MPNAHAGPARAPERVGKYEILLPIASGGMATVYLARTRGHGGFEQDVALKLTHAHLRETTEFVVDLLEEAKLAARIRHRNVVSILDVGDDPNGAFLVMDYVEGDTLAGMRRRATTVGNDIPMGVTARVLIDALAGLHAAHELTDENGAHLGLVHRDFSPQNLLVGLDGVVKLTDFGIAKAAGRLSQTRSGLVKGKIAYMAPEQAKAGIIDRRTDVWAAGIVAWEFFSGIRLYPAGDDVSTLLKVVSEAPPRLRGVAPHVPQAIEEAVARALTMDIAQRTPTASAFGKELTLACRAAGHLFEYDEVAEFMQGLVGPKIAERRRAATEIAKLRLRVGQLTEATAQSGATPSADMLGARAPTPSPPPEFPIPEVEAPTVESAPSESVLAVAGAPASGAPSSVPSSVPASMPSMPSAPSGPMRVPPPSYEPPTRTDTTSVSASTPMADVPKRGAHPALVAALSGGAALALVLVGMAVFTQANRAHPPARSAAAITSAAPVALTPTPTPAGPADQAAPAPPGPVAAPPPTATGAAPLAVHASAPIAALRIGGRAIPVDHPSRDLDVALEAAERDKGGRIDAVALDGREARVAFGPKAVTLRVDFPAPRAATPTPPPAPTVPLAPNPTTPKVAPLAPDPYAR